MNTLLGINSDKDFCECCGKTNLSRVMWIEQEGNVSHYGTTCGAKILNQSESKAVKKAVKLIDKFELWRSWSRMDLIFGYRQLIKEAKLQEWNELCDRWKEALINDTEKEFEF